MAKEICISSTPHETRLAILEDDQLAEIYYERENEYTLAGSIYNGRVTRVLPGMQSAFVDVGLERDAFLYVTDFMELEDPEETDELEKAAVAGGSQAPREVRHSNGQDRNGGRQEDRPARPGQKPDQKQEQKQDSRQDRPARDRRPPADAAPEAQNPPLAAPESLIISEQADETGEDSGAPGTRRWRGRRRRRGGRGPGGSPEGQPGTEPSKGSYTETTAGAEVAPEIQAAAGTPADTLERSESARSQAPTSSPRWAAPPPPTPPGSPRADRAPVPFVLPGESLSKYGGAPGENAPKPSPEAGVQARPSSSFKPATLVEAPLGWDGSGLLPGESLSKHRGRQPEPALQVESQANDAAPDEIEEEELVSERSEPGLQSHELVVQLTPEELVPELEEDHLIQGEPLEEDEQFEESTESASEPAVAQASPDDGAPAKSEEFEVEPVIEQPSADEPVADPVVRQDESVPDLGSGKPAAEEPMAPESDDPQPDRSASHHIDPSPHTGFRLFGLGGKKKTEEPVPAPPAPVQASVATVSAYAPGSGLIEEEVLEEEEFEAVPHHHHGKASDHDFEDFEEETLPTQIRSGELGEMFQEAHLDHRIQLNLDGKNGEDEGEDAFDEDEDEEPSTEVQPAPGEGQAQQRRDRGGRGRRGRGPQGAQAAPSNRRGPSRRSMQTSDLPIISDLLKSGQEILVQIAKEPIAKKGARITSHIALPGRFLVFMPTVTHIGVSRKIVSDEERQRLKRILISERGEASGGFIVRTAAEGASEEDLRADLRFLLHLWDEIKQRSESSNSPALIYHDLSLIERILRDQVSANFSNIWVDSEADYERIVRFLNRFSPSLVRRVKLYTKELPLFEHFGIQDEISKALRSKVWLKSGGSIVINQTEALVAIDINTGKYVGKSARLEDTILKTNLDAVPEIVRQIRLRDLGGIIVIDFIDMDERKNRFKVMAALEEALKSDRAPTKVLQFNDFGLVAITRKRVKQSLERTLSVPCPTCQATGMVKSPTTVCNEIYTELRKMRKHFEGADVLLRVNPETVKVLKANNASWLTEFEELVGKNILVKSDATVHPEQFDIQG
jgi:ribonuclease G